MALAVACAGAFAAAREARPADKGIVLTAADSGRTVTVRRGESITLRLAGNPTTGYRWQLRLPLGPALEQQGDSAYVPDPAPGGIVGSGGTEVWKFKGIRAGRLTLVLEYRRPWEKDQPPARTVTYAIRVR